MSRIHIIVDENARNSVALLQNLSKVGELDRVNPGFYVFLGRQNAAYDVTDEYPEAVMKVEVM